MLNWATVKPSIINFVLVTLLAIAGITLAKWAAARIKIPGLSDLILAV